PPRPQPSFPTRRSSDLAADAAKAFAEDLSSPTHMFTPTNQVIAPSFVSYVTGQLLAQFGKDATYSGGLRVITTLNPTLQQIGQKDRKSTRLNSSHLVIS